MQPIAYRDLRQYIQNNWNWIAVVDDGNNELMRLNVNTDPRASFDSDFTNSPVTAVIDLTGQDLLDAGASLPETIDSTESFMSSSATQRTSHDHTTGATIQVQNDEVTITHDFNLST